MAIATALLTILAPLLSVLAVAWADSIKEKRARKPTEDLDAHITQHLAGNPTGLLNLSRELERLQHEAARKRNHPGQS